MHAVDRGTQLSFSRTIAGGQAAARIADRPELFETDCFFRRMGLHLGLELDVAALDQATLDQILMYCAGVNDGLSAQGKSLPMWITGYEPHAWDVNAVLLVSRLLGFGGLAVSQLENEILLIQLIHAGANPAALADMFSPRLDHIDFDLVKKLRIVNHLSDDALDLIVDLPRIAGSNAWAVSPRRSATGSALLAGDPHLEVNRLPAIWYEAILQWDGGYVMGATLPGVPLFATARNSQLAWSVTYIKADTIDLFIEDCRRILDGGWQYRRDSQWFDFDVRDEVIARKGADDFVLRVLENDVGTLDSQPDESGLYLSIAWAGRRMLSSNAIRVWLELIHCPNVSPAMDLVSCCPQPTLAFVFADRDGHIGLQGCGKVPAREDRVAGLGPVAAWTNAHHWNGWLDGKLLPSVFDPEEGFVATANEECNPQDGPLIVTQIVHDYRLRRIRQRLLDLPRATLDDMQALQYDVVSVQADDLLSLILPELPEGELRTSLESWDRRYDIQSQGAPVFQQLYRYIMMEMLGDQKGIGWRRMLYLCSRAGFSSMVLTAADRLLQKDESWWWHGRNRGEIIRRAARRVVLKSDLTWSDVNNFHFVDRFVGSHHVGRLLGYNTRKHAMPGCHATPFQGHVFQTARREATFAPSYHFVTDLGRDEAWTNLPGGPSEHRFSRYYQSDIPLWTEGEYKRLSASTPEAIP
jgi:penicillin amidase